MLVMEHALVFRKLNIHDMAPAALRAGVVGSALPLGVGAYCATTSC